MGQKRSGKDSLASFLVSRHGFRRLAFADRLKAIALHTDPLVDADASLGRLSDLIYRLSWEGAKEHPEVRGYLQSLGVAVREHLGEDTWIRPVIEEASRLQNAVVTDVRFPNEAEAIRAAGGFIVRVNRLLVPDTDRHVSEHAWRSVAPDAVVSNDEDLGALAAKASLLHAFLLTQEAARAGVSPSDDEESVSERLRRIFAGR
jgi:hypothetical protein